MSGLQVTLRTLSKPVVAAVHGAAIGGGAAFAICCDMVVVGTNLKFGYPELKHHLTPTGVTTSLLKQVGPKAAFEMISLGANFAADDVMRLGLANRAVAPEAVLPTAIEIAKAWAENDAAQLAATKNMFYRMTGAVVRRRARARQGRVDGDARPGGGGEAELGGARNLRPAPCGRGMLNQSRVMR